MLKNRENNFFPFNISRHRSNGVPGGVVSESIIRTLAEMLDFKKACFALYLALYLASTAHYLTFCKLAQKTMTNLLFHLLK